MARQLEGKIFLTYFNETDLLHQTLNSLLFYLCNLIQRKQQNINEWIIYQYTIKS